MLSKYKTIHISLTNVHLDCRGEGSSNRNARKDESVETGDESVETRDEYIEAGEKQSNHVIIVYKHIYASVGLNESIQITYVPLRRIYVFSFMVIAFNDLCYLNGHKW